MAKVLFVNPLVREEAVPKHVPYGIALLASIVMEKGHLVQVYDANAWRQGDDVLRQVFAADDWQVIALGGITTAYGSIKHIVAIAREVCPEAVIVLGGGVLKTIGKGATRKNNIRSFFWTLDAGIRPIPNLIIGFPNEDFESIRLNMTAWDELGIVVKPHFATPYPGSEWFTTYRESITEQYGGNLEDFLLEVGDASTISAVICHSFNAVELIGLRELTVSKNFKKFNEYENIWRKNRGIPDGHPSTLYQDPEKLARAG